MDKSQEILLVLLAQSGDKEAFNDLLKAIQEPLYRYIFSMVGQQSMAEDILQEVFVTIYRKLYWLREPELFRPWAYRITTREVFKSLKRERKWSEQIRDELLLESLPSEELNRDLSGLIEELPRLISTVSPASRVVIILHYLHEMPLDEVADVLGLAIGTVKSRLSYGLASLRNRMGQN